MNGQLIQPDCCASGVMSLPGPVLEPCGRRYVKMLGLDAQLQKEWGTKVVRGGCGRVETNAGLRDKVHLYAKVQAAREQAYAALGKDLHEDKEDAPFRLTLGGLQDFTAGRENEKKTDKRAKGYAPWRPTRKC